MHMTRWNPARPRTRALLALLALWLVVPAASAATRAWLDRSRVALGETVMLNIQTDQPAAPDYGPLRAAGFEVGQAFRRDLGREVLFGVPLTPRRSGRMQVPPLRVGAERTPLLALEVAPARAQAPRGEVFVETAVDHDAPWVQQSVGVVVRLHYATPILSGQLGLEAPEGASLQRVGDDVHSSRELGGRAYRVIERRYLLVPERSGELRLGPARFRGRGTGGFFDDFFGTDRSLAADGPEFRLQVRPQPDGAPQPWLPLHELRLRYLAAPSQARAGEAVEIAVEAVARGATASLFPEIPVPRVDGAQVFPERAELSERFVDGSPQLTVVRRYAVVPLQPGTLQVPGVRMDWWDARAGQARTARLPDLRLEVAPGTRPLPAAAAAPRQDTAPVPETDDGMLAVAGTHEPDTPRWLVAVAVLLLALWLATLAWALRLRRRLRGAVAEPPPRAGGAGGTRASLARLRHALDAGSFDEVVALLRAMATPPAADLDGLLARLADPVQRQALEGMRRALWAGQGDAGQARAALRAAFRDGPRWTAAPSAQAEPLPPLYPR